MRTGSRGLEPLGARPTAGDKSHHVFVTTPAAQMCSDMRSPCEEICHRTSFPTEKLLFILATCLAHF